MAAIDDTIIEKQNWHWRNSMRPVRFFNLDARAAMPYCFLLVYARWVTLFICIVSTALFIFMERRGLTFPSALRAFRVFLLGSFRPGLNLLRQRRFKDYG
jgi:intracellular multiplication protein IcmT